MTDHTRAEPSDVQVRALRAHLDTYASTTTMLRALCRVLEHYRGDDEGANLLGCFVPLWIEHERHRAPSWHPPAPGEETLTVHERQTLLDSWAYDPVNERRIKR